MKQDSKLTSSEAPRGRRGRPPAAEPIDAAAGVGLNRDALAEDTKALDTLRMADQTAIAQGELYRRVGSIETAHFYETVSSKLMAETFIQARSLLGKLGSVTIIGKDGHAKHVSRLEDFCEAVMPVSLRRCQQIASQYEALGPALFEQAQRIGFRARDYQALKALPHDDQEAVKRALEAGSREDVVDLLAEFVGRNEALRKKADEAEKTLKAKQTVIDKRQQRIQELEEQLDRRRTAEPEEREAELEKELRDAVLAANQALILVLKIVDEITGNPLSEALGLAGRQMLDYMAQRFNDEAQKRGLTINWSGRDVPAPMQLVHELADTAAKGKRS